MVMNTQAMSTHADLSFARLLRLASPALPVGAFSYSQGLEWAVESGAVYDVASAGRWILDAMRYSVARCEAPCWLRLHAAWCNGDTQKLDEWNTFFLATREGGELRAETIHMGRALREMMARSNEFPSAMMVSLAAVEEPSYPMAFAAAVFAWRIESRPAMTAYLWSWAENQVIAAMKLVPLGQTHGQSILAMLIESMPSTLGEIFACEDDDIGALTHGLAIASAQHETQYSRLFRS
jgi:urease accessory protein